MALLSKQGYGQLEPNFLVAQRTGEVFSQLPFVFTNVTIPSNSFQALEQGMFLKYDYAAQKVTLPPVYGGDKLTFLQMSEIRLFGPFLTNKDFALFPSPTDATSSYVSTGIIPGLAQAANQILSTTGNVVINVNSSPTGFTAGSMVTATITFNDGSGSTFFVFTNTGNTVNQVGATQNINGQFFLTGSQITSITFTTTSSLFPVITNKSIAGITFSGVNATTTNPVTGSAYINTAIAAASTYTSTAVGNAYGQQVVYPRLYKPTVGDIITTNLVCDVGGAQFTSSGPFADITGFTVGAYLTPNVGGVLQAGATTNTGYLTYRVVAISTTPDLQAALKLQCVQTP